MVGVARGHRGRQVPLARTFQQTRLPAWLVVVVVVVVVAVNGGR